MPTFTIEVSDKAVAKLQQVVQTFNEQTGKNLTVKQWVLWHLKNVAVHSDLVAELKRIEEEGKQQMEADSATKHEELLAELA